MVNVGGLNMSKRKVAALGGLMILTGISMILVLSGLVNPPPIWFWTVIAIATLLFESYSRWQAKGVVISFLIVATGGSLYACYLLVMALVEWLGKTNQQFTDSIYGWHIIRIYVAIAIAAFQMILLIFLLSRSSQEKRTPYGLLKTYMVEVVVAACAMALTPMPWGFPYIVWAFGVTFTSVVRVSKVVRMTTSYYKPKADGNRTLAVHDDGAISGSLDDLMWGYNFAFVVATLSVIWFVWFY